MTAVLDSDLPDQALVVRLGRADDRALADLYDRHAQAIYSLAAAILRDEGEAEEVVEDVFLELWRRPQQYESERGPLGAFLVTMARSRALDRVRARARHERAVDRAAAADTGGIAVPLSAPHEPPHRSVERREASETVRDALADLPQPQRLAIELAYFGGLSQSEIATELSTPLGTIKTRIRDGMEKLRMALGAEHREAGS